MHRKGMWFTAVIILLLTFLISCGADNVNTSPHDRYRMDRLQDCAYALAADTAAVCVYENKVYAANAAIGYYDLQNDMAYTELWRIPEENGAWEAGVSHVEIETEKIVFLDEAPAILACDNGVWYAYRTTVYHIGHDGSLLGTYPLNMPEDAFFYDVQIFAAGTYTYVFLQYYKQVEENIVYTTSCMTLDEDGVVWNDVLSPENLLLTEVCALIPKKKNKVSVLAQYKENDNAKELQYGVFLLNGKTGDMALSAELDRLMHFHFFDFAEDNSLFACSYVDSVRCYGKKQEHKDFLSERNLSKDAVYGMVCDAALHSGREPDAMGEKLLGCTGDNVVLWDYNNRVIVFIAMDAEYGSDLTVLSPTYSENTELSGYMSRDAVLMQTMFAQDKNIRIHTQAIDASLFNEKLRLKMLAGEDDYDIVLLEDAPELLPSVLLYSLYLPLEENNAIREGYRQYIDGLENIMTYDGHIFGIPYAIEGSMYGVLPTFGDAGLTAPENGYTWDAFWMLCDAAGEKHVTLINDQLFFEDMMSAVVEEALENGTLDAESILPFLEKFQQYRRTGVLGRSESTPSVLKHMNAVGVYGFDNSEADLRGVESVLALPSAGGKVYYTVESMTFVSAKTKSPDLSREYIAYMLANDYPAMLSTGTKYTKCLLYKNPSSYYYVETGRFKNGYRAERTAYTPNIYESFVLSNSAAVFQNAALAVYTAELKDVFRAVLEEIDHGTLTMETAAEKIVSEVKYRFEE